MLVEIIINIPKEFKSVEKLISTVFAKSDFEYMFLLWNERSYSYNISKSNFKYLEDAITWDFSPVSNSSFDEFSEDLQKLSDVANAVFACWGTIEYKRIED